LIENKIRPLALGRKNYLFAGSHDGAKRIAMMYTFMATCKANEINPSVWLEDALKKINETSIQELNTLIPGFSNTLVARVDAVFNLVLCRQKRKRHYSVCSAF
jgi:hypothetical protein